MDSQQSVLGQSAPQPSATDKTWRVMPRRQMGVTNPGPGRGARAQPRPRSEVPDGLSILFPGGEPHHVRPAVQPRPRFGVHDQDPVTARKLPEQNQRIPDRRQSAAQLAAHLTFRQTTVQGRPGRDRGTRRRGQTAHHRRPHAEDERVATRIKSQHQVRR